MLALAEALEDAGHAYATADGNVYYAVGVVRRATASCRATRSTTCAPAIAATSSPTSATRPTSRCGRPPARAASQVADGALGRGFPGLAPRVLGDGDALPRAAFDIHTGGIDNVFPHHEDEIAQSAPIVGGPRPATGSTASSC